MKEHLMIYFRRFITPFAMSICILVASWATAQTVIDFEEISLAPESVLSADASETPILTQAGNVQPTLELDVGLLPQRLGG